LWGRHSAIWATLPALLNFSLPNSSVSVYISYHITLKHIPLCISNSCSIAFTFLWRLFCLWIKAHFLLFGVYLLLAYGFMG
jgi:hypothetical protein